MRHLSPSEFVDLADGALAPRRAAHLDRCDACRAQARALGNTARDAGVDDAPDPSPLFWDDFQARVHGAIAGEPAPHDSWFLRKRVPAVATALVMSVALAVAALYPRHADDDARPAPRAAVAADAAGDDAAWAVLREVAGDIAVDEAHAAGLAIGPGAADTAVLDLTPDERNELGRLLRNALKQGGA